MAFTSVGSFGSVGNATDSTTLDLTPTVTMEAGNFAILSIAMNNEGQPTESSDFGHLADTVASVTDTGGNIWELIGCVQSPLSAGGGSCTSLWKSVLDTQLTTGSTITITFGVSITAKAATGWEFEIDGTEVSIEHVRHYATTGTVDVPSATLDDLPSGEYLAIRSIATESRTVGSFTPTTNFTGLDTVVGDSGAAATSMWAGAEFDIFTGTSITSDPTKSGNDTVTVFTVLKEGPQDKPVVLASNLWANLAAGGSPRWPQGHKTDDIALLLCETGAEAVTFTTANGYAAVSSSPQITTETRLSAFWCRATSDSMAAPVIPDVGDHLVIKTFLIRGCIATGDPWDVVQGSAKDTPSTSVSITGLTTTVPETLVVSIATDSVDLASDEFSAWANADLTRFRELDSWQQQSGNGGGFGVAVGRKATAGAVTATTATIVSSVDNANLMIAFKPASASAVELAATTAGVATVTGNLTRVLQAQSSIAGIATVTGDLEALALLQSAPAGIATVTGNLTRTLQAGSTITGVGTVTANVFQIQHLVVSTIGVATVNPDLETIVEIKARTVLRIS